MQNRHNLRESISDEQKKAIYFSNLKRKIVVKYKRKKIKHALKFILIYERNYRTYREKI